LELMLKVLKNRNFFVMLSADFCLLSFSLFLAYTFRFDGQIPPPEFETLTGLLLWVVPIKILSFYVFGLYKGMWRYTGILDMKNLAKACLTSSGIVVVILFLTIRFQGIPRSILPIDFVMTFFLSGGVRIGIRLHFHRSKGSSINPFSKKTKSTEKKRLFIIGAGDAGEKTLRELEENSYLNYQVIGLIDDDPLKKGRALHDIPVLGGVSSVPEMVEEHQIHEIIIAIPSADREQIRKIVEACELSGAVYKTLPGMGELIDGRVSVKALRDVSFQDLLGRPPVELDMDSIGGYLTGKCVMITGAGGSIGSELCRQITCFNPETIILFDASEPSLYSIQMELKHRVGYLKYKTILGRAQNPLLTDTVFRRYRPQVIFHAAAYKHVPMLERNPWEALHNNIHGSKVMIEKAIEYGAERFVLVSTDKAVRSTNVMGASKRFAEMVLRAYQGNGTLLMAVRFGNVVGSSGSVIPLFRDQISRGGPVTITHPEVTRFFMTIPEAAQLILQAGALGRGDEIFILEMGTPVKIVDMARDLIRLCGKEPDRDIEITFTGLRQGEKLYEELITADEGVVQTGHEKIMVLRNNGWNGYGDQEGYRRWLLDGIEELKNLANTYDGCAIRAKLKELVPEYDPRDSECVI